MSDEPELVADRAVDGARRLFLDDRHQYGCAEATLIALKDAFGLEGAADSSAAMALNGGIAYSGGACGAISGAAVAVGLLAGARVADHRVAKRIARALVAELMAAFRDTFGAVDCRGLIGIDLAGPGAHDAFIAGGVWRDVCLRQVEFSVGFLAPLALPGAWEAAIDRIATGNATT